jgi:hypothetical protein
MSWPADGALTTPKNAAAPLHRRRDPGLGIRADGEPVQRNSLRGKRGDDKGRHDGGERQKAFHEQEPPQVGFLSFGSSKIEISLLTADECVGQESLRL